MNVLAKPEGSKRPQLQGFVAAAGKQLVNILIVEDISGPDTFIFPSVKSRRSSSYLGLDWPIGHHSNTAPEHMVRLSVELVRCEMS